MAPNSKLLGMFAAKNPALAHLLLPQNSDACADFCFKVRECEGVKTGVCPHKRHYYAAKQIPMQDLEAIGDSFLANGDGFFVDKMFRNKPMAPKYDFSSSMHSDEKLLAHRLQLAKCLQDLARYETLEGDLLVSYY